MVKRSWKHSFQRNKKALAFTSACLAPQEGLEPTTLRLTAECSAIELLRNIEMRQRPTLPGRLQPSTIGVLRLNFCVRNGNRWNPQAITTAMGELCCSGCNLTTAYELLRSIFIISEVLDQLNQAIDRLVSSSYTHYCASTDDLSTW